MTTLQELAKELGFTGLTAGDVAVVLLRLGCAAILGAFVAYRPWRRILTTEAPPRRETAQAQTLIAVAGAVMVVVIGDSTARAFGLVGLGGFIRFRSGIKDTRDAAVMFVMIGVGMACGLGLLPMALLAAAFASIVLVLFDATGRASPRRLRVELDVERPAEALAGLRAAFVTARVLTMPGATAERGTIVLEVEASETIDAAAVRDLVAQQGVTGVHGVTLEED